MSKKFSDGVALINGKVIPIVYLIDKNAKEVTNKNHEEIISSLDKITSISFNIYIASDLSDEYQIILTIIHELCIHAVRFAKIMTMRGLSFKARVAKIFAEDPEEHHQDIFDTNSLYNKCIDDLLFNCTSNYEQNKSPFHDSIHVVNAAFENGETMVNWYNKSIYNSIVFQAAICEKSGGDHYIDPATIVLSSEDITMGGGRRDGHRIAYTKKI